MSDIGPVDTEHALRVQFWGERDRPDLMSIRFVDMTNQILGEAWVSGPGVHEESYEMLYAAIVQGCEITAGLMPKKTSRDVFITACLALIVEAALIGGLVEEERPAWAAEFAVGLDNDD